MALRLLYLFCQVLWWLVLLSPSTAAKHAELLMLRHKVAPPRRQGAPAAGSNGPPGGSRALVAQPHADADLVVDSWHTGGLQAIDVSDPGQPTQAGWFSPTPLASVAIEDPALSRGPNKVVMWSHPIIRDGLIYVVDVHNG